MIHTEGGQGGRAVVRRRPGDPALGGPVARRVAGVPRPPAEGPLRRHKRLNVFPR